MSDKKFRHKTSTHFSDSNESVKKRKKLKSIDTIDFYEKPEHFLEEKEVILEKEDINTRLNKINDFAGIEKPDICSIAPTIYLHPQFKKLSMLYKTILNVYNYSTYRKLSLIYEYHKISLERIYKHTIEVCDLQKLKFLCGETLIFRKCIYREKETFNIIVKEEINIESRILAHIKQKHSMWLLEKGITSKLNHFHKEFMVSEVEIEESDLFDGILISKPSVTDKAESIKDKVTKEYEEILQKNKRKEEERRLQYITNSSNINNNINNSNNSNINVKEEYNKIIDKINKKEEARRMAFIEREKESYKILSKINEIFQVENKKAIKLSDLLFRLNNTFTEERLMQMLSEKYTKKQINGTIYVIIK